MKSEEILTPDNLEILSKLKQTSDYQNYFKWFLAITQIPHETFHCEEIETKYMNGLKN